MVASGIEVLTAAPGTWCRVKIVFELGPDVAKDYVLTTTYNDKTLIKRLPFAHQTFTELSWLGISAADDADGIFYLDNMILEIE